MLACLVSTFAFSQTEEELREEAMKELQTDMEELRADLNEMMADLREELGDLNIEIDLSGLDELENIDWSEYPNGEEAAAYFQSEEWKQEMDDMQREIDEAMKEVERELAEIDWEEIQREIDEALEEAQREIERAKEKE